MARPISTSYSDEERDEVIAHVLVETATGRFVSRILAEDKTTATGVKLPAQSAFWLWTFKDEELQEKLAQARARGVEALLDECGEIADDAVNDYVERQRGDGAKETLFDKEHVLRSKLRIETRFKLAQMMAPRKYGPKLDLTSGGEKLGLSAELEAARKRVVE